MTALAIVACGTAGLVLGYVGGCLRGERESSWMDFGIPAFITIAKWSFVGTIVGFVFGTVVFT